MHEDVTRVLFSKEQLDERVKQLGAQIAQDYAGKDLVVVAVLRGAAIFMSDLVRAVDLPLEMDYMAVSSYGNSAVSSGRVQIVKDLSSSVKGRHVLIAEDVLDTGLTLSKIIELLEGRGAESVEIAALFRKEGAQKVDVSCKYVGFPCPNEFIVGYGLDYAERYRNLPYVGVLDPRVYS